MLFSKKLRHLEIEVEELEDDTIYSCMVLNKKKEQMEEEAIEISGNELKVLAEMQGKKYGMIRYSSELFYDVVEEKEKVSN